VKKDKLTADDVRRLNELVHLELPRHEAFVISSWLHRLEESHALVPTWQHDSEQIVLRDLRAGLERLIEEGHGDIRLAMTRARALVLGDWLLRMDQSETLAPYLSRDGSEQRVLWTLEAWLDHTMIFEFHGAVKHGEAMSMPGYEALVRAAREEVATEHLRTTDNPANT